MVGNDGHPQRAITEAFASCCSDLCEESTTDPNFIFVLPRLRANHQLGHA
jgi:hypothetical protein